VEKPIIGDIEMNEAGKIKLEGVGLKDTPKGVDNYGSE